MNTAEKILRGLAHSYSMDANPLYCWEAWRVSRESGEPLPEFASDYFDRVAAQFVTMPSPEPKQLNRAVVEATEFRGGPFSRAQRHGVWEGTGQPSKPLLFSLTLAEMAEGASVDEAWRRVEEEWPVSYSQVRDAYYEMRPHYHLRER